MLAVGARGPFARRFVYGWWGRGRGATLYPNISKYIFFYVIIDI
tara:strand:- start:285 stop:416 length:132 start_codon:yes stop_codon:yes gene_type:complete